MGKILLSNCSTLLMTMALVGAPLSGYGAAPDARTSSQRIEQNNAALKKAWSFGAPNKLQVSALLAAQDFGALEKWYSALLAYYKQEVQYEQFLAWAFDVFDPSGKISPSDLDAWVAKTGSPIAHAVRGCYKGREGYNARGYKFAAETSKEQFATMQRLHDEAAKDLQSALDKDPALMPAYIWLIGIAQASDMPFTTRQVLDRALKQDRRTFEVRLAYMRAIVPRWGGSYEEMARFAAESVKDIDLNPRLWSLQGDADADLGDTRFSKDPQAAIDAYTKALRFGDRTAWLTSRGDSFKKLGEQAKADGDYARVRLYDTRTAAASPARQRLDLSTLRYDLKDNSYVDPGLKSYGIRTYAVVPVEHTVRWLNARADEGQMVMARNGDKIQGMVQRLGYACVKRTDLDALSKERNLPLTGLSNEGAQAIGRVARADAVIVTTVLGMGVDHTNSQVYVNLDIKAVSVESGRVLWKSVMNGRVDAEKGTYRYQEVLDAIETKLYEHLSVQIAPGPSRQKVNAR